MLHTAELHLLAWISGGWRSPPPSPHALTARISDALSVPVGARGRASHAWWAMVLLLLVDATVFASMLFAHVHVSLLADICPPPGAALPAPGRTWDLAGRRSVARRLAGHRRGAAHVAVAGRAIGG